MGVLRVYLALCVIFAHTQQSILPWAMHDGVAAVQIFYLISGFYMAMVLSSARYGGVQAFYLSRFLRIFLTYWLVLAGILVWSVLAGLLFHRWLGLDAFRDHPLSNNGASGFFIATFSNLTLFGQDWVMFLSQDFGKPLSFTANFRDDIHPLYYYLLIPQSWSIGLEITFYVFAPYLNRLRTGWLVLIVLVSSVARIFAYWKLGLAHDPWTYRFFPFEIAMFVGGMLAYRLYSRTRHLYPARLQLRSNLAYGLGVAVLFLLFHAHLRLTDDIHLFSPEIVLYLSDCAVALAIPILFFAFGNHAIDRFIGELSYPIYLVHWSVILTVRPLLAHFFGDHNHLVGMTSALFSILVAIFLSIFFITPLDKRRHLLAVSKSDGAAKGAAPAAI